MDHADAMRLGETIDHVENPLDRLARRQGTALVHHVLERLPRHQLHDDVGPSAVGVGGEHEDAARVRDLTG